MLTLCQSNKLEKLAQIFATHRTPPASPFETETIIVQSLGMGPWISMRLAESEGICANVRYRLPGEFIWDLRKRLLGNLPDRSPFAADVMTFRIKDWLADPANLARSPELAGFLGGGGEERRMHLAARLAGVFDRYLVYREDWLSTWEAGKQLGLGAEENWQSLLWRDLVTDETEAHRARRLSVLLSAIEKTNPERLPNQLSVFGVASMPPVFMEVLVKLAEKIDVNVYAVNPCKEYWSDIRTSTEIERIARGGNREELHLEAGNPLLASLGKQGREFFEGISDPAHSIDAFDHFSDRSTLLNALQADILELVDRKAAGSLPIDPGDGSLQIHVCHSPMREIEVLRDQVLAMFDADPTLNPNDVAILMPDIEQYTPYIEAVFGSRENGVRIPFSVADRGLSHTHPILETFLALLDLPESRFGAATVLSYLEQPSVMKRFGLSTEARLQIRQWVDELGIRWGRDPAHKGEFDLPESAGNTWREALHRILLGYALPTAVAGDALPLFQGALPFDDIEGERTQTLGQCVEYIERLAEWADALKVSRSPEDWADALNALVNQFFDPTPAEEEAFESLVNVIDGLREAASLAKSREPLGIQTVKSWLSGKLGKPEGQAGFLTGEMTFCALVPMRSLPFRVIALLGMNHDAFPRHENPPGFDLMAANPRPGDRSRRLDDRYMFLETLLSARDRLYISYVGRSVQDNSESPPSPLVSDLVDAAKVLCGLDDECEQRLITHHPLQPFDRAYFSGNPRMPSYSKTWLEAAIRIGKGEKTPEPLFERPLPPPDDDLLTIEPNNLVSFFRDPARFLLNKRLNLTLVDGAVEVESREPFALDYRSRDRIREDILESHVKRGHSNGTLEMARSQSLIPHGAYGDHLHAQQRALVDAFAPRIVNILREEPLPAIPVQFSASGVRLEGCLDGVRSQGVFEYAFEAPKPRQVIGLWLKHLMLCLADPPGIEKRSVLWTPAGDIEYGEQIDAAAELTKFLKAYRRGLSSPLPFFPKTSHTYADARVSPPKKIADDPEAIRERALKNARNIWEGTDYSSGESESKYNEATYRDSVPLDEEFEETALDLLGPMMGG